MVWEISKLETTTTWGLTKLTFKQELENDLVDNLSWINTTSNNYSDTITGIDYDYYCARTNDTLNHTPVSPSSVDTSIITYTGLKPTLKVGGSFKTFTANIYKQGTFVNNKPYWNLKYYKDNELICSFNFTYNSNNELECDGDKSTIIYEKNGKQVFGIKFKYDKSEAHYKELKIKCMSILEMIGGTIILTVDDQNEPGTAPASLNVEVTGL